MSIKIFSKRLKTAREQRGMSQRSLGLSMGLSDKTISSYEKNRSYPTVEQLHKISMILKMPLEYFILEDSSIDIYQKLDSIEKKHKEIQKDLEDIKKHIK